MGGGGGAKGTELVLFIDSLEIDKDRAPESIDEWVYPDDSCEFPASLVVRGLLAFLLGDPDDVKSKNLLV